MTGQDLIDLVTSILGEEEPNPVFILQLINLARLKYEALRPWKVLSTVDSSQSVGGSNTYLIPFDLPDDFHRYLGESTLSQGSIVLFDGSDNIQYVTEVPIENILFYRNEFQKFAVDYGGGKFYLCGIVPGTFDIYQYYIKRTPPITLATGWESFPDDYAPILAFDAAARWRLGTDYDDVAARNADDNVKMANTMYETMSAWDTELAISAINSIDYVNNRPNYLNNMRGNNFYRP